MWRLGKLGPGYMYLPAEINNSFETSLRKKKTKQGSLRFIWKGSGKLKLLEISLLSVSLTVIKKCLNDLNNTWFNWQALIALYQAKRRWMLSRKPQVRQADSLLVWHRVPMYRPVFTGALPASKEALYLPINFHCWQAWVVCDALFSLLLLTGSWAQVCRQNVNMFLALILVPFKKRNPLPFSTNAPVGLSVNYMAFGNWFSDSANLSRISSAFSAIWQNLLGHQIMTGYSAC